MRVGLLVRGWIARRRADPEPLYDVVTPDGETLNAGLPLDRARRAAMFCLSREPRIIDADGQLVEWARISPERD